MTSGVVTHKVLDDQHRDHDTSSSHNPAQSSPTLAPDSRNFIEFNIPSSKVRFLTYLIRSTGIQKATGTIILICNSGVGPSTEAIPVTIFGQKDGVAAAHALIERRLSEDKESHHEELHVGLGESSLIIGKRGRTIRKLMADTASSPPAAPHGARDAPAGSASQARNRGGGSHEGRPWRGRGAGIALAGAPRRLPCQEGRRMARWRCARDSAMP